jgi:hypothetical protein
MVSDGAMVCARPISSALLSSKLATNPQCEVYRIGDTDVQNQESSVSGLQARHFARFELDRWSLYKPADQLVPDYALLANILAVSQYRLRYGIFSTVFGKAQSTVTGVHADFESYAHGGIDYRCHAICYRYGLLGALCCFIAFEFSKPTPGCNQYARNWHRVCAFDEPDMTHTLQQTSDNRKTGSACSTRLQMESRQRDYWLSVRNLFCSTIAQSLYDAK